MPVEELIQKYECIPGERFSYSSSNNLITYDPEAIETPFGKLSLLHEIAHLKLGHFSYKSDFRKLRKRLPFWGSLFL